MSEQQPAAPESLPTARQKLEAVLTIYIPHSHGVEGAANAHRAMLEAVTEFEAAVREDERARVIARAAETLTGKEVGEIGAAEALRNAVKDMPPVEPPAVSVLDVPAGTQLEDAVPPEVVNTDGATVQPELLHVPPPPPPQVPDETPSDAEAKAGKGSRKRS